MPSRDGSEPVATEAARLFERVYDGLRAQAVAYLGRERAGHTLQPTALVHEAWLKLADQTRAELRGEAHFQAVAAQAMRRILVDHARVKKAEKRGGELERVEMPSRLITGGEEPLDLLGLDAGLEQLGGLSERQARIVELRFFGGLEQEQVADALGVSVSTVEREWRVARAFLAGFLRRESGETPESTLAG